MKIPQPVKLKSGVYRIQLKLGGKSVVVYGDTPAECRREANTVKANHLSGRVVQRRCNYTVRQAIDAYIDFKMNSKKPLSPTTVRGYKQIRDNRFQKVINKPLDSVDWQAVLDAEPVSPKTLKNSWLLIYSCFKFAKITPPVVILPDVPQNERPFLDADQIPIFLEGMKGSRYELGAMLGLHSMRRSEFCDLTGADIDLNKEIIHVRGAMVLDEHNKLVHKDENKTADSARDIPIMIPRMKTLLSRRIKECGNDGHIIDYNPTQLYKNINKVCQELGLPEIGCHGLRHSFVSLAYHLKWDELTTMRIAGYSSFETMRKIYTHLAERDKNEHVTGMTEFFKETAKTSRSKKSTNGIKPKS